MDKDKFIGILGNSGTYDVYIPSCKKNMKFRGITAGQQKKIIKSLLDRGDSTVTLPLEFNQVLIENAVDGPDVVKQQFMAYDRDVAIAQLYIKSSDLTKVKQIDKRVLLNENTQEQNNTYIINVEAFADNIADVKLVESDTINIGNIDISVSPPTLAVDTIFNKLAKKSINFNDKEKVSVNISQFYIYEICKFINTIEVHEGTTTHTFSASDFVKKAEYIVEVIEKLPNNVLKRVLEYIEKVRELEKDLLTTQDGHTLSLDTAFFS